MKDFTNIVSARICIIYAIYVINALCKTHIAIFATCTYLIFVNKKTCECPTFAICFHIEHTSENTGTAG